MEKIKNAVLLLGICAAVSGIFYIVRCYGMAYPAPAAPPAPPPGAAKEVEIVATAEDSKMQTPVIYPVGTVSSSAHKDEAKAFEDFLQTDEAKAILEKAGFTINE